VTPSQLVRFECLTKEIARLEAYQIKGTHDLPKSIRQLVDRLYNLLKECYG
jgi:hypothetical protein